MNGLKHSKVKNTGLVFELLVRQVASDTMSNKNSPALNIIKKHFTKNSELTNELKLYRSLKEETFNMNEKSIEFVDAVITARKNINESQLKREKYNLIKNIKSKFVIEEFFKSRVHDYKIHASVYKLFEYAQADDPKDYIDGIDTDRVMQFHLAGHSYNGDMIIDTHDHPVCDSVWDLYRYALRRFGAVSTMIERDDDIPPFDELRDELVQAETIARQTLTADQLQPSYPQLMQGVS